MLSILIPIYNFNVNKLVDNLQKQCDKLGIDYEILCFDDGSSKKYKKENEGLRQKFLVNYVVMSENLGRSKIRNWLSKSARYEWLLFLDCDSGIIDRHFVNNYLVQLANADVIYGGRIYQKKKPTAKTKILHWKYGSQRESLPVKERVKHPILNFMSNNFIISAAVFEQIKFDEDIETYGYEDLLFARQLAAKNFKIRHIDNPVKHLKLETTHQFLKKTKLAILNLADLYHDGLLMDTRLVKFYEKLRSLNVEKIVLTVVSKIEKSTLKNLESHNPSIWRFNLWKLGLFIQNIKNKSKSS